MSRNRALCAPSISQAFPKLLGRPQSAYRGGAWPAGLTPQDLDFLDPASRLFSADTYLLSAGQYLHKKPVAYPRNPGRSDVKVIGDSGGFQIIDDHEWYQGQPTVLDVIHWQEAHCNVGLIIDIPSRAPQAGHPIFDEFAKCLETTKQNIAWAKAARSREDFILLNVAQGNTLKQVLHWYNEVKSSELDGWGFGGKAVVDLNLLMTLMVRMRDDGELEHVRWMHMLGTGIVEAGLAYTAIRRAIEGILGRELPVSFDCSTPFTNSYRRKKAIGYPKFGERRMVAPSLPAPTSPLLTGSTLPFPFGQTAIGKLLTVGDICINPDIHADHAWDELSHALVASHNFDAMLKTFDWAHKLFDMPPELAKSSIPNWLIDFKGLVAEILTSEQAMGLIKKHRGNWPLLR